jgi:hypothetical protein
MALEQSRGRRRLRGLPRAAFLLGPVVLAACGSVAAPGSGGAVAAAAHGKAVPAQLALCASPATADRVVIARSPTASMIQPQHVELGAQTTVTHPVRVRALAQALCALPKMAAGIVNCPALLIGHYQLSFTAAARHLPVVTIQESGCKTVTGLGPARTVSRSPGFWPVLARTVQAGVTIAPRPVYLPEAPVLKFCEPVSTRSIGHTSHCPGPINPGGVDVKPGAASSPAS